MSHRSTRSALAGAAILVLAGGLSACSRPQSGEALVTDARRYLEKGERKAALIQLRNAASAQPADPAVRLLLGGLYNDMGDAVSAEKEARKALDLGASPAAALPALAQSLLAQGRFQDLLNETAADAIRNTPRILALRGRAYLALAQPEQAKASFTQALQLQADDADALTGLARHALSRNDTAAAVLYVEQAVARAPKNLEARLFQGELLRFQGQSEAAIGAYQAVLALEPQNAEALLMKAHLYIGLKKWPEAQADIGAARKLGQNKLAVHYAQARLDYAQGRNAAALDSLQQVLKVAPGDMPSLLLAGAVQYALGSMPQAEQHLKAFLANDPGNLYARKLLASTLLRGGQGKDALATLAPALKEDSQDTELYSIAGESALKDKQYTRAGAYFALASKMAPREAKLHTAMALSTLALGNDRRAVGELETAASLDRKSGQASTLLVMTLIRLKEYDKALAAARAFRQEQGENALGPYLEGGVYAARKDIANARRSYAAALALQPSHFASAAGLAQLDMLEKKPADAKQRLLAFQAHNKKNLAVLNALASLAMTQGDKDEASSWLERAARENPEALEPALQLAGHYLQTGDTAKALAIAKNLRLAHAADPDVLDLLAQIQYAGGDLPGALDSYSKLAAVLPTSALAQFRIAQIYLSSDNDGGAASALKNALLIRPDYLDAQQALVAVEVKRGNYEQAIGVARQVQKQLSKLAVGFLLEGDVRMKQNQSGPAAKLYAQAYALSDSAPVVIKLHDAMTRAGQGKEADARIAQWLDAHPADAAARMYMGGRAQAEQRHKVAARYFLAVLKAEPKNAEAMNNLAWSLYQEKDEAALDYAQRANKLAPDSPAVLDTLGWLLVERGDTARGLPLLQRAAALAPQASDVRYHVVLAHLKGGDKAAARKELDLLLASNKDYPKAAEARQLLQ